MTANDLIEFWRLCTLDQLPFIHPEDHEILSRYGHLDDDHPHDFKSYLVGPRFSETEDSRFHLSLIPIPYVGDIARAEIVVLLLNPGFKRGDYWAEMQVPGFRDRLERNLHQTFKESEPPFFCLDPEFCWYGGFEWWEKKLRQVVWELAFRYFDGKYRDALRDLSHKLACIELVPYHSSSSPDSRLIDRLQSSKKARQFLHQSLLTDSEAVCRTVIVTRQVKGWGLASHPASATLSLYEGSETRMASLDPKSKGGKAILKHYDLAKS